MPLNDRECVAEREYGGHLVHSTPAIAAYSALSRAPRSVLATVAEFFTSSDSQSTEQEKTVVQLLEGDLRRKRV